MLPMEHSENGVRRPKVTENEAKKVRDELNKAHVALFNAQRLLGWSSKSALEVGKVRVAVYKLWRREKQ